IAENGHRDRRKRGIVIAGRTKVSGTRDPPQGGGSGGEKQRWTAGPSPPRRRSESRRATVHDKDTRDTSTRRGSGQDPPRSGQEPGNQPRRGGLGDVPRQVRRAHLGAGRASGRRRAFVAAVRRTARASE